jgi:hypothetical protein
MEYCVGFLLKQRKFFGPGVIIVNSTYFGKDGKIWFKFYAKILLCKKIANFEGSHKQCTQ